MPRTNPDVLVAAIVCFSVSAVSFVASFFFKRPGVKMAPLWRLSESHTGPGVALYWIGLILLFLGFILKFSA
jgi:ABC-type spermidine/putrescine transport system permease subunit II